MSVHRLITTSFVVLTAAASLAPLAAQSAVPDTSVSIATTAATARLATAITATPSTQLTSSSSAPLSFSAPRPTTMQLDANRFVPTTVTLRTIQSPERSRTTAMMIVGTAGLLVGAVVGGNAGTILMVGGGVVALVGLWKYLQ